MKEEKRFPELDALRGLAILLMVLYHTAFDLDFFWGWPVLQNLGTGGWLLARTSATLFLLVAGICSVISWERKPFLPQSPEPSGSNADRCRSDSSGKREPDSEGSWYWQISHRWKKVLRRFLTLAGAASLVSFATWLMAPADFIKFGILHLFALSTLLLPLFAPLKHWNGLLGLLIILSSYYPLPTTNYSLFMILLGFPPPGFTSLDYFPLLPWFGIMLIGLALGHYCYIRNLNWRTKYPIFHSQFSILNSIGRYSLIIYLLHQPVLIGILSLGLGPPQFP